MITSNSLQLGKFSMRKDCIQLHTEEISKITEVVLSFPSDFLNASTFSAYFSQ